MSARRQVSVALDPSLFGLMEQAGAVINLTAEAYATRLLEAAVHARFGLSLDGTLSAAVAAIDQAGIALLPAPVAPPARRAPEVVPLVVADAEPEVRPLTSAEIKLVSAFRSIGERPFRIAQRAGLPLASVRKVLGLPP